MVSSFRFENKLWRKYKFVAGVDEVGRGAFAGPVVAGCVIFTPISKYKWQLPNGIRIDDSKKLTPKQREKSTDWIKKNTLAWGIGESSATLINRIGMGKATRVAFRKAISEARKRLGKPINYLLLDAFFVPFVSGLPTKRRKDRAGHFRNNPKGRQKAVIDGDEKSLTISAASIIAKVYRDKLMLELSLRPKLKKYGWERNKGYGTRKHIISIRKYGITQYHRRDFVKNFFSSPSR